MCLTRVKCMCYWTCVTSLPVLGCLVHGVPSGVPSLQFGRCCVRTDCRCVAQQHGTVCGVASVEECSVVQCVAAHSVLWLHSLVPRPSVFCPL